jgi:hypothetical protein
MGKPLEVFWDRAGFMAFHFLLSTAIKRIRLPLFKWKRLQHIWQVKLILFDKRKVLHRSVVGKWLHHHTNCIFLLSHLCTIVHPRLDHDDVDGNIQGARQCHVFGADFLNAQTGFFKH